MKSLKEYIRDINISTTLTEASLLDEIDNTLSVSSNDLRREAVKKFIKEYYDVAAPGAKISATPNKDDKFEVSAK